MLEHSIGGGFFCYPYFVRDPLLQNLRNEAEFQNSDESSTAETRTIQSELFLRPVSSTSKSIAAKRRKNSAHGVSRRKRWGKRTAPAGRKISFAHAKTPIPRTSFRRS